MITDPAEIRRQAAKFYKRTDKLMAKADAIEAMEKERSDGHANSR